MGSGRGPPRGSGPPARSTSSSAGRCCPRWPRSRPRVMLGRFVLNVANRDPGTAPAESRARSGVSNGRLFARASCGGGKDTPYAARADRAEAHGARPTMSGSAGRDAVRIIRGCWNRSGLGFQRPDPVLRHHRRFVRRCRAVRTDRDGINTQAFNPHLGDLLRTSPGRRLVSDRSPPQSSARSTTSARPRTAQRRKLDELGSTVILLCRPALGPDALRIAGKSSPRAPPTHPDRPALPSPPSRRFEGLVSWRHVSRFWLGQGEADLVRRTPMRSAAARPVATTSACVERFTPLMPAARFSRATSRALPRRGGAPRSPRARSTSRELPTRSHHGDPRPVSRVRTGNAAYTPSTMPGSIDCTSAAQTGEYAVRSTKRMDKAPETSPSSGDFRGQVDVIPVSTGWPGCIPSRPPARS